MADVLPQLDDCPDIAPLQAPRTEIVRTHTDFWTYLKDKLVPWLQKLRLLLLDVKDDLQNIMDLSHWQGDYDPTQTYNKLDTVRHGDDVYFSLVDNNTSDVSDSTKWQIITKEDRMRDESHLNNGISSEKMKYVYGNSVDDFYVITPLPNREYVRIHFESGVVGSGLYSNSEYSRVTEVELCSSISFRRKQYSYYRNISDNSDAGTPSSYNDHWKVAYGKKLIFNDVRPTNGRIAIEFYTSSASSEDCEIYIDGLLENRISTRSSESASEKRHVFYMASAEDKEKVDVTIANTSQNGYIYIRSVGYAELADITTDDMYYDDVYIDVSSISYTASKGASDFAFYDADLGGYCLSYHGGEEKTDPILVMGDSASIPITSNGELHKKVKIHQKTKLVNDKLHIRTMHEIIDGGYRLDTEMEGDINLSTAYTFMNTTNPDFHTLYVPYTKSLTGTTADEHEYLGSKQIGTIIQGDGTHTVESRFTVFHNNWFKDNGKVGAYIRKHTSYLKPYYGWCKGQTRNLKDIKFSSVRLYT